MRLLALLLLTACSAPTVPYLRVRRLEPFDLVMIRGNVNPWFVDGPPSVFTAVNPTQHPAEVDVWCWGDAYMPHWIVRVAPRDEVSALGQLMNGEMDTCMVVRYRFTDEPCVWLSPPR